MIHTGFPASLARKQGVQVPPSRPRLYLPRLVVLRLLTLLLLATIGVQASEPVRPLQHKAGSAFSAATADVAIVGSRRAVVDKFVPVPMPFVMHSAPVVATLALLVVLLVLNRPYSTGPPCLARRKLRPAPARAPPLP
ncbi:MAG: hypothetical protein ACOVQ0_00775 [Novosphingobium sp.]|uniref:hypothetical protein n=1 Tax=Novosphingobium sp. TaxID=1874826 RepID=UPI003B9DA729